MRHNKHRASLGVTREHRAAMLSNLGASLIKHGRIQTTLTKAKALRPFIEKVVTKARKAAAKTEAKDAIHLRRLALRDIRDEEAVKLLFTEKHKDFANRPGGYTRIYKLGARISDAAEMALIEFIPADDPGYKKKSRKNAAKAKKAARTKVAEPEAKTAEPEAKEAPAAETAPAADVPAAAAPEAPAAPEVPAAAEGEAKKD
jgi:large subunit ribosomal protein L17